MTNQIRFNKTSVTQLEPAGSGKRRMVYDTETPGLTLQITPKGTKSFYLYRWVHGHPEKFRLGRFPAMTVEQARRAATAALGEIAQGNNPVEKRRNARAEMAFEDLYQLWMVHAKAHKRTWQQDENQYRLHLSHWSKRSVSSINQDRVRTLHQQLAAKGNPIAANRVLTLISAMFNHAIRERGLTLANPCQGIKKFPEHKRESWITPNDMPAFFKALEAEPNEDFRDFFSLLLLTGARKGNVLGMRSKDVNLAQGLWTIPSADHKNQRVHTIPLSKPAMAILRRRMNATSESEFVFPGSGQTGHLVEPKSAWKRITRQANMPGLRIHDLRHTLASWQVSRGVSLAITGQALGHTNTSTTARYAHLATDPVRDANEQAASDMITAAKAPAETQEQPS